MYSSIVESIQNSFWLTPQQQQRLTQRHHILAVHIHKPAGSRYLVDDPDQFRSLFSMTGANVDIMGKLQEADIAAVTLQNYLCTLRSFVIAAEARERFNHQNSPFRLICTFLNSLLAGFQTLGIFARSELLASLVDIKDRCRMQRLSRQQNAGRYTE